MKNIYLTLALLLSLSIVVQAQPKLQIEGGNVHDWGIVKPIESPLKTIVKLKNVGDKPLRIFKAKPGCGCTVAPLDKDVIQPGEYATLNVKLDLKTNVGQMTKNITITTNDPRNKTMEYLLKCDIMVPLMKFPKFLSFGKFKVGETGKARLNIENMIEEDIKIMKVYNSNEEVALTIKEGDILRAGSSYELVASFTPKAEGNFKFDLTFMTDNIDMPRLRIRGWGKAVK